MLSTAHHAAELLAKIIELIGVSVIVLSLIAATILFLREGHAGGQWRAPYERYRANLGRGILLGLELMVGADIIATVTAPLTVLSVGLLGGIVVIRTFLSFSLETEIEGCWPWQRRENSKPDRTER